MAIIQSIYNGLRTLTGACRPCKRPRRPRSLALEPLEDRDNPSSIFYNAAFDTIYVNGSNYNDHMNVSWGSFGSFGLVQLELQLTNSRGGNQSFEFVPFSSQPVDQIVFTGFGGNDSNTHHTSIPIRAYGGTGNDTLRGNGGADLLVGGDGDDWLYGYDGNDTLQGGNHRDLLYGGNHNDSLAGEAGNDGLYGDSGNDTLSGGDGDDALIGYAGDDWLYGDAGKDSLHGMDGNDRQYGGSGDDFIHGWSGNDYLYGDAGNDQLYGADGNDGLYGGDGNDMMYGGDGNDGMLGYAGDDFMDGEDGNDSVHGMDGNDELNGGTGNDFVNGWDGNDTLYGWDGDDQLYGANGIDFLYGGGGADELNGNAGTDRLYGSSGNDLLSGDEGDDFLSGGSGNDTLYGDAGDDQLSGDMGDDQLYGAEGNDALLGWSGADYTDGGVGYDRIFATPDHNNGGGDSMSVASLLSDVVVYFRSGYQTQVNFSFGNFSVQYGSWNSSEVWKVDEALATMVERTGDNVLLRRADNTLISMYRHGAVYDSDGNLTFSLGGWNSNNGNIHFVNNTFSSDQWLRQTVYHEIAHNWDDEGPLWNQFRQISGWTNPQAATFFPATYTLSTDGSEAYLAGTNFARQYGETNSREDFATAFAQYFIQLEGSVWSPGPGYGNIPAKLNSIDAMLDLI